MFPSAQNGNQSQQSVDYQRHCILVSASNPHPLSTPVFRPQMQNLEQSENIDAPTENRLSDAETIAKSFALVLWNLDFHTLSVVIFTQVGHQQLCVHCFPCSAQFLCLLFVQSNFLNLEQYTMR